MIILKLIGIFVSWKWLFKFLNKKGGFEPSFLTLPAPSRPREGEFPLYHNPANLSIGNLYKSPCPNFPKTSSRNIKKPLTNKKRYVIIYIQSREKRMKKTLPPYGWLGVSQSHPLEKTLDKKPKVWYNEYVKRGRNLVGETWVPRSDGFNSHN